MLQIHNIRAASKVFVLLATAIPIHAQDDFRPSTVAISANILGLATLNPNLDLEARISGPFTIGATAWWEVREVQDRWAQLRATWYPLGAPMKGPSLSATAGIHRAWREVGDAPQVRAHATSATLGALVGWDFRPGARDAIRLGLAGGAKATLSDNGSDSPLEPVYAEARLVIGIVF